ncbi:MAG: 3-deoxy-manno-octulosonate cytidylyltransferase [Planctomycetota bacterium]
MNAVGIIPARYHSTRLPGKPLLRDTGKYLVQHVWERAAQARSLDRLVIATDDEGICRAADEFGAEARMTSAEHETGTDRIAEVAADLAHDVVVNIQGDEAEIEPDAIDTAVRALEEAPDAAMATLACPTTDPRRAADPNVVKVVLDTEGRALYFSRAPIPHHRDAAGEPVFLLHVGLYAYRRAFLLEFARMPQTPLEQAEKLEQLRALENGHGIQVAETDYEALGIDTPADYQAFVTRHRQKGPTP